MTTPSPNTQPARPVRKIGPYQLLDELGTGGMSTVFRALHEESGAIFALKILPRYLARKESLLQRFLREARNAEHLEHPNIVMIHDRGVEAGRHFLVLEYVDGPDLHDRVTRQGPLAIEESIRIIIEACKALRYASRKGVIHRDIKPANILVSSNGDVKLIDLGLAYQSDEEDQVTREGTTVGTVDYMSPEQARNSRSTTLKSDIYSLGCTFYYLLTGFPPFFGGRIPEKLRRHALQGPPDVRLLRSDAPKSLARLIKKMMAKKPEDRFDSYEELIADLQTLDLDLVDLGSSSSAELSSALAPDDADFTLNNSPQNDDFAAAASTQDARPVAPSFQLNDQEPTDHEVPLHAGKNFSNSETPSKPADPIGDVGFVDDDSADLDTKAKPKSVPNTASKALSHEILDPFGLEDDEEEQVLYSYTPPRSSYRQDHSSKSWVIGGAVVGLLIALIGIALVSLIRILNDQSSSIPKPRTVDDPTEVILRAAETSDSSSNDKGIGAVSHTLR